jgi:hypothetical protein
VNDNLQAALTRVDWQDKDRAFKPGQFVLGTLEDGPGPAISSVESLNNTIRPGQEGKQLTGRVAAGGQAVALELAGDVGYWTIPVTTEDVTMPGELQYDARLSFTTDLAPGPHAIVLRAADGAGHFGAASTLLLNAQSQSVDGALVISLTWDTEADLDLHVIDAGGTEIWARHTSDFVMPQPGDPVDPAKLAAAGYLDDDSNAQCVIDGRRQEDVLWKVPPPPGVYTARVDAFSLCGASAARWAISATWNGAEIAAATGFAGDADTRTPHQAGSGVFAIAFQIQDGM